MPSKDKLAAIKLMVLNPAIPFEHRRQMLVDLCIHESEEATALLTSLLDAAAASHGEELYKEKIKEFDSLIAEMKAGPLRFATFIRTLQAGGTAPRALVRLEDGTSAVTVVPEAGLAAKLSRGDRLLLDGQARAALFADPGVEPTGEEARFERRIGSDRLEVSLRGDERVVIYASQALADRLERSEVEAGASLLISSRQGIAWDALPAQDTLGNYSFLDRGRVPNVRPDRDIGSPPPYLAATLDSVRAEMTSPEGQRVWGLRRCQMVLLSGRSGTGKTLSVYGLWNSLYELMSEATGVPVDQLPPRVLRLRAAQILSMWFGESEKNIARFFREIEQLSDEHFVAPDGKEYELPVLVILEEVDGIGRSRGHDPVYDRVMTTLLQLLDPTRQELRDRLVVFVTTTNVEGLVDTAVLRRVGATIAHFGPLDRRAFIAVISKHLGGMPVVSQNGLSEADARRGLIQELTAWLYSPNGEDRGQVELAFANTVAPAIHYRRDFLTGGLVDRAVQDAATRASRAARRGARPVGLTAQLLMKCFNDQIQNIVERLEPHNVASYLDLPEGLHLTGIRRIARPAVLPSELMRAPRAFRGFGAAGRQGTHSQRNVSPVATA